MAAEGGDTVGDVQPWQFLAYLDPHRAVGVRGDALETGAGEGAVVDVEAAGTRPVGGDRRLDVEPLQFAEVDEADAAGAVRCQRGARGPAADLAPVVQHHVVRAQGGDRPVVDHGLDLGPRHYVHARADQVGRSRFDPAVGDDLAGAQQVGVHLAAVALAGPAAVPGQEHPAAPDGRLCAANRYARKGGGDAHRGVRLAIPQGEGALQRVHPESVRPLGTAADIGRGNDQPVDVHVAGADRAVREQQHLSGAADVRQADMAEGADRGVVEDGQFPVRHDNRHILNPVIRAEPYPLSAEAQRAAAQADTGPKGNHRHPC